MSSQGDKGQVKLIYLDNASSSRRSRYLVENVLKVLGKTRTPQEERKLLRKAQNRVLRMLGVPKGEKGFVTFVPNATHGINELAYFLIPEEKKGKIRVHLSDSEHAANHLVWMKLAGENLEYLPLGNFRNWNISLGRDIFSFVCYSNLEGIRVPLDWVEEKFRGTNHICIVDASQYMQHHLPNLSNTRIDYFVFTAHKCFGPNGVGVVFSREYLPIGINEDNHDGRGWEYSYDYDSLEGWIRSLDVIEEQYRSGFMERESVRLNRYFRERFPRNNKYVELVNGDTEGLIFLVRIIDEEVSAHDYVFYLGKNNVVVRAGLCCSWMSGSKYDGNKIFRVSLGVFNGLEDIDVFVELVEGFSPELCF